MKDKTQTKIYKKRKCQDILKKGIILDEEQYFIGELLINHPDYEKKKGCGISNFFIKKTIWNNNGFFIKRKDNSETDFSYLQCLNPRTDIRKIKMACRSAIKDFVMLKDNRKNISHHEGLSFKEIFNLWIENKKIDNLKINDGEDNCMEITFKDKRISNDFAIFHNQIARIKEVSSEEHKEIHRKIKEVKEDDCIK